MEEYSQIAKEIRRTVLDMIYKAQTSHIGSNFSCIDILTVLHFGIMKPEDKFILSKSWAAASMYAILAKQGVFPESNLETYCIGDSKMIGLISHEVPGVIFGSGSMGSGLPVAVGLAMAKKMKKETGKIYVLMSDGEMNCGTTWESALIAAHHKLNNLIVIVDKNGFQAMGRTEEVLKMENLIAKWNAFNWNIQGINGHDCTEIYNSFVCLTSINPHIIIADTIKGKGVKEFEDKLEWHYRNIPEDIYKQAIKELA